MWKCIQLLILAHVSIIQIYCIKKEKINPWMRISTNHSKKKFPGLTLAKCANNVHKLLDSTKYLLLKIETDKEKSYVKELYTTTVFLKCEVYSQPKFQVKLLREKGLQNKKTTVVSKIISSLRKLQTDLMAKEVR